MLTCCRAHCQVGTRHAGPRRKHWESKARLVPLRCKRTPLLPFKVCGLPGLSLPLLLLLLLLLLRAVQLLLLLLGLVQLLLGQQRQDKVVSGRLELVEW